jgi:methyltransferase (TIGR00027 family)
MQSSSSPSRTALSVALRRAAHQRVDVPVVFEDRLAQRIVSAEAERMGLSQNAPRRDSSRTLRAFLVARSRYAEDTLAAAVHDGITQYVLLGAGLDTFSYRNPYGGLRCFEVDHPATQHWKLGLLTEANIAIPPATTHVPVDFEHQDLTSQLVQKGFDPHQRTFFAWLGVVPYLTLPAFESTLDVIASQPSGSGFVMDYSLPRASLPSLEQLAHDSLAARVAAAGEPFQLFFDPKKLHELLRVRSLLRIEDLDANSINQRYFNQREDGLAILGTAGHLLSAWKAEEEGKG